MIQRPASSSRAIRIRNSTPALPFHGPEKNLTGIVAYRDAQTTCGCSFKRRLLMRKQAAHFADSIRHRNTPSNCRRVGFKSRSRTDTKWRSRAACAEGRSKCGCETVDVSNIGLRTKSLWRPMFCRPAESHNEGRSASSRVMGARHLETDRSGQSGVMRADARLLFRRAMPGSAILAVRQTSYTAIRRRAYRRSVVKGHKLTMGGVTSGTRDLNQEAGRRRTRTTNAGSSSIGDGVQDVVVVDGWTSTCSIP